METTTPQPETTEIIESGSEPIVDDAILYRVLKYNFSDRSNAGGGPLSRTVTMLRNSGVCISLNGLQAAIAASPILRAHFGDGSTIVHTASPMSDERALLRVPQDGPLPAHEMAEIVRRQDEFIAARGLEGVGFSSNDLREMESMSQFVGHAFKKTVDITHGVMVTQLWKLHKRADELRDILNNDERAERFEVTERGEVVRFTAARYTDQEKLDWQKEYRNIVDLIRQIADSANQGAAIRLKAELASRSAQQHEERKAKKRRLKAAS